MPPLRTTLRRSALALALLAPVLAAPSAGAQPAPSSEALKVARDLVTKAAGDRNATIQGLRAPMIGMMQQMGVRQPDRAQAVVQEAILPLLDQHYDELMDLQAKSYAQVLSVPDMQAISQFYSTPAGQSLIRAQPQLAQLKVAEIGQWMGALQPEMQTRIQAIMKTHGWDKG